LLQVLLAHLKSVCLVPC